MNLLMRNGTIVEAGKPPFHADVLVLGDKIAAVAAHISQEEAETLTRAQTCEGADGSSSLFSIADFLKNGLNILDIKGMHLFPGLVDAHCHLRDPGQEYREDIHTGTRSAAAGGFTDVACMPNTKPVADNKTVVRYIIEKAAREGVVRVHPIGSVTKGLEGLELSEMGTMKEAGIVAVSDDGRPVVSASVMLKAMTYAAQFGLRVISHCEDPDLAEGGAMNEGVVSTRLGLRGIPSAAEEVMVSRELILAENAGLPVHIAHVSTALAVQLIREAKKRGVNVTAETCPHYFTLTEEACEGYDTDAKMNPPLRTEHDRIAIIEGLKDGTLDMIATDHAPHHIDEKNVEFDKANNGIVGFETALPLALTFLVKPGFLSMSDLVDKMSKAPAAMLGLPEKKVAAGYPADLVLVDMETVWTVNRNTLASKSRNTPYHGWKLNGLVKLTMVAGQVVARDGKPID